MRVRVQPVGCSLFSVGSRSCKKLEARRYSNNEQSLEEIEKEERTPSKTLQLLLTRLWYGYDPMLAKESLILKQKIGLSRVYIELTVEGRKRGHWSHIVFPNDQTDPLETNPKSALTAHLIPLYLAEVPSDIMKLWRSILEIIVDLIAEETARAYCNPLNTTGFFEILPTQDRRRVQRFLRLFQGAKCEKPSWLCTVLDRLSFHLDRAKFDPRA